ncbi:YceK/YidQ family lipoprotein [Microbulbifer rhizosphaerae]|uniref:YceK/YidQ family lipoprotein n=1 Tax=Microbulbifer rhizosphaerae TaxID=1562603 RepID=UPI001622D691
MNKICMSLVVVILSGCGTVKSLQSENNEISMYHKAVVTNCTELPYVYSGVLYDVCLLDSKKRRKRSFSLHYNFAQLAPFDIILSGAADTLILPLRIYQQSKYGNMTVRDY